MMPLVKTTISYEEEDFGDSEVISYSKHVEDLDIHSWLWYLVKISTKVITVILLWRHEQG